MSNLRRAAEVFPMLPDDELAELTDGIAENALLDPLVLQNVEGEPHLVDGRNRRAACKILNIEPKVRWLDENENPAEFVYDSNERRNQTKGQKAMMYAQLFPEPEVLRLSFE